MVKQGTAQAEYESRSRDRQYAVDIARECASLTIPHLFPENRRNRGHRDLPEPYHSIGTRAVNNLSSTMLLATFPPNDKFMRLAVDEGSLEMAEQFADARTEVEENLAKIEDIMLDEIEAQGYRTPLYSTYRQLVVAGNVLLKVPPNSPPRVFPLDTFVVLRDPRDQVQLIIVKESVARFNVPEGISIQQGQFQDIDDFVDVYTVMARRKDHWDEWQEIENQQVSRIIKHRLDQSPYMPLRMYRDEGESYGHGQVEEYLGDLRTLNTLSKALVEGSAASAVLRMLVDPSGLTNIEDLTRVRANGAFAPGREQDVHAMKIDKFNDYSVVRQQILDIEKRIGLAFLLNSTVPRQAERVTAEEIRLVASELEDTLGGTYSLLSTELQLPLVRLLLHNLQAEGKIPDLGDNVRPKIVTGLDAIGRGHDLRRLDEFVAGLVELFGPQAINIINPSVYANQRAIALGIDTEELIKDEEQVAEERQQLAQQESMSKLGPELIRQFGPQIQQALGGTQGAA